MIELQEVTFRYPDTNSPALRNVSFTLKPGECVVVTGESGSGKSTLARVMGGLIPDFGGGSLSGRALFRGRPISEWGPALRREIGVVFQDPERQMIAASVRRELVSGMEFLGMPRGAMRRSLAEVAAWLGLAPLLDRRCDALSGGEKQKVVIGAALAIAHGILILDEPTSQLDPVAAAEVFGVLRRLRDEFGMSLLLIEQRLDGCLPWADRIAWMHDGRIACDLPPGEYCRWAIARGAAVPQAAVPLESPAGGTLLPLTVADARKCLAAVSPPPPGDGEPPACRPPASVCARGIRFSYDGSREALRGLDFDACPGTITCILGGNGAGKSTLLAALLGLLEPAAGSVSVLGEPPSRIAPHARARRIGYLSQNPDDHLAHESVAEEIAFSRRQAGLEAGDSALPLFDTLDIAPLWHRHPRDLSAGERRRVALAATLATDPEILLLDEPTRGAGGVFRSRFAELLRRLAAKNRTIILATQDVEFAAEAAARVALMFDGEIVDAGHPSDILASGLFFSTVWGRILRGHPAAPRVLTRRDAVRWLSPGSEETTEKAR